MTETAKTRGSAAEVWLENLIQGDVHEDLKKPIAEAIAVLAEARRSEEDRPFLTVVMRTQGKKPEAFKDAILTLYGQSDQDFELLVMAHNTGESDLAVVRRIIDQQAPSFRERIRLVEVTGGGRSRPLNTALTEGRGRYFAFFDDDDLVFGHWVESFHTASEQQRGRLLRAVGSTQRMEHETWPGGASGFRSTTWPKAEYLRTFEFERHLERNHSPFMSVAFPRELFETWGERFDEVLDVCEDWDMILRGAFLVGVTSVDELTVVYRLWTGVTSSYTEHDRAAWQASEARVRDKLNSRPSIMPEGAPNSIVDSMRQVETQIVIDNPVIHQIMSSTSWRITAPLRWVTNQARRAIRR
ncbi:glycosyltransferase family 2 protein [Leucobacter rhizosphaerae]|uniref:Glycosyltransferase family 2 protein n=1 Tax=Leucobacter rhizosphaerae TaxID=2932245 RepID=A0ABY4FUH1_9MICO|nr:glycosyltransferase family 2 protein [Leucobacter rhizosphaerae]UOQ59922.1 glycosyltransferase family 2 protein [Leucobacter rhizosphaerae]